MRRSRFTDEQVIGVLREARFGGMGVSEARRLRHLDEENRKLKQLLAEATLDNHVLRELLRKNA